jgi:hypothetical protein
MASVRKPTKALSQIIDRVEEMREQLLSIQHALERIESAEDFALPKLAGKLKIQS